MRSFVVTCLSFAPMLCALTAGCRPEADAAMQGADAVCTQAKAGPAAIEGLGARLELEVAEKTIPPVLLLRFTNIGDTPLYVDRELVFFVAVNVFDKNGKALSWQDRGGVPGPPGSERKERFVLLRPGEAVEREVDLGEPVRTLVSLGPLVDEEGHGLAYVQEGLVKLVEGPEAARAEATYFPESNWAEGVAKYVGLDRASLKLHEGRLRASVDLR
jgi:hypothetical protein